MEKARELMTEEAFHLFATEFKDQLRQAVDKRIAYTAAYIAVEKAGFTINGNSNEQSPFKDDFSMSMDILKTDEDQKLFYGWASVIEENGEPVVDLQGDIIEQGELLQAAHEFIKNYRQSKEMHKHSQEDGIGNIGTVVESMVFTPELQKALGIDLQKTGWLICVKVENKSVWEKIKTGEYKAFSIGGSGVREPVE